jgi:hypothetical protein
MDRRTPYDSAVNSLTAFALAHELNRALQGVTVNRLIRYAGGHTVALDHATIPFLHLFHFGREPELVPSRRLIVSEARSAVVDSFMVQSRIREVRPLGMDRIILFRVTAAVGWTGDEQAIARLDMTPARMPLTVFRGEGAAPSEWHGPPRAARPTAPTATPARKPLSLLALPPSPPEGLVAAATREWPENTPEHTRRWGVVKNAARTLVGTVGGLDPVLAAALSRSCAGDIAAIWPRLVEIGTAARERRFSWRRYEFPEEGPAGRCAVYPVALPVTERPVLLDSALEAIAERLHEVILPAYVRHLRATALSAARRSLKKSQRLAGRLAGDLEEASRAREYRQCGNLLVTNRHLMKRGMREIEVRDFSGRRTVTIPLSPHLGPDENIRRYFSKAKKGEKGVLIITRRKREIEREIIEKHTFMKRISEIEDPNEIMPLIPRRTGRARREVKGTAPFKRFVIDERHTVLVGRKDRENDELTHRIASPRDLWFHAQGVPGSHVILRGATRSTPKRVLERAAAIAAYFSKARHSSTVPVIYAEKRYVRKPRGSPPGTAVCQRGKTLYVRPSLPDERDGTRGVDD